MDIGRPTEVIEVVPQEVPVRETVPQETEPVPA